MINRSPLLFIFSYMSSVLSLAPAKHAALMALAVFALLISLALMPRTASAAALTVLEATTTSNNTTSTLAKSGDTFSFGLQLSGTPVSTSTPVINIQGMGTTTMSGSGAYWRYSTTTSLSWSDGAVSFLFAYGDSTPGAGATTTKSQANLTGANVTIDNTAPSAPVADPAAGSYSGTKAISLTSSGSNSIYYAIDTTATCTGGTLYATAINMTSSHTLSAVGCDTVGNTSTALSAAYTIAVHHSSGGGGGGGSSHSYAPTPSNASPSAQALAHASPHAAFNRNLSVGLTGDDVKTLQMWLNAHGFTIAASGPGSMGMETSMFGGLTRAALVKFQLANHISPAVGFLGPITRAAIAGMQ